MKNITSLLAITSLAVCISLTGCGGGINDQLIINGVSVGVSTGLTVIKNPEQRQMIKNLLQGYAPGLRTLTDNPTPEQLAALIDQYTPADIKEKYPEAVAFATPLVINAVEFAVGLYGSSDITRILNDVATGLELGSTGNKVALNLIRTDARQTFPYDNRLARGAWFCEATTDYNALPSELVASINR